MSVPERTSIRSCWIYRMDMDFFPIFRLLPFVMVFSTVSESYNLTYHHTFLATMKPDFFADLYLNDICVYWYDSNNKWLEPRAPWRRDMAVPNFWLNLFIELYHDEHQMRNLSSATETVQYVHGCTENGDSFTYFFRTALSGREILRFDSATGNFSSEAEGYEGVADALNENQTENAIRVKELTVTCHNTIDNLLRYGHYYINRKVQPVVMVFWNGGDTLQCRAYGHYPKEIHMKWYMDGHIIPDKKLRVTLPLTNEDYLSVLSVNMSSMPGDTYTCRVNHSSLEAPVTVQWKRSEFSEYSARAILSYGGVIAITMTVVLFVIVALFGFILWSKERKARLGSVFKDDPTPEFPEHTAAPPPARTYPVANV